MPKLAIIAGAGPAGLTAAYELLKRTDVVPLVVEQTDAIGGIAQTYNYKGNRIDIGGHRFFSKSERVMNWWFNILPLQGSPSADTEENGHEIDYAAEAVVEFLCRHCVNVPALPGETRVRRRAPDPEREDEVMLQRPRLSRIYYRRNFFPYPIAITLSVAARLGLWNTFRIGMSYIRSQLFPRKDETYLDAFFINRFGQRLYETFFRDYTVKGLSLKRAIAHAVRDLLSSEFQKAQEERETSLITRFFYPKYGPGQMWETVARHVGKCGGEIRMRTRVVGVELSGSRVRSVTLESLDTGARETVRCDYFFSTMPIRELTAITTPAPPRNVAEVAGGLQYRDFLTVGLLLKKLHVQERGKAAAGRVADNWIYVQDGGVRVGRIQVFNNWSPYMVADYKNTVWIGLEYFVDEGDDVWRMPDRDLVTFGVRELELIGFARREDVLDGCVLRMPKAYPAYFGTYERLTEVQAWANTIENLFLVGRNGMHRYNNQDHSMLTAMLAVDNIIEGRVDKTNLWDVNLEMVYHEERKPEPTSKTRETPERVKAVV
jgi:protoporphyrinogen oxidase